MAQNPEVLVHLLKENESRGLNPSVYTTPASAFNTLAVDFKTKPSDDPNRILSAGSSMHSLTSEVANTGLSQNSQSSSDLNIINPPSNPSSFNKSLPRNFGGGRTNKLSKLGGGRKFAGSSEEMASSQEDMSSWEKAPAAPVSVERVKVIMEWNGNDFFRNDLLFCCFIFLIADLFAAWSSVTNLISRDLSI